MRATGLASAAGSSALLLCLLASASSAQNASRQRAPIVRVYSQDGGGVVSNYVTPAIEVSEDAYVFAVMMDLDGHIQILHPDFPGISVRLRSHKQLRLPNFLAGFNEPRQGMPYYTANGMVSYDRYGLENDTRGTVIALASRAPFNLELIEASGDWNISAIRRLIEHRTPTSAAQSLAQYLGARGEPIGRDFMRFAGQRQNYYAYNDLGYCGYNRYAYSLSGGFYGAQGLGSAAALRAAGLRPLFLGYDACGMPIIAVSPFTRGGRFPLPPTQRPPGDTTVFPKSRFPGGIARHPIGGDNTPQGIFPLPQRAALPQMRDVPITAPQRRRAEPREILEQFRSSQPGRSAVPDRARTPIETVPSRAEPAVGAFQPARDYRPEPRVIDRPPSEPARAPERVRESPPPPPPVIHERPAPPPPSPKTEPAHVPPPRL